MNWPLITTRRSDGKEPTAIDRAWDRLYEKANETLKARIEEHGIPLPDTHPAQDLVLAYRIPNEYQGRLHLPETAAAHAAPYSIGVLLLAGAEATGVLESHGILPGDYIQFAKYAGDEETAARVNEAISGWSKEGMGPEYIQRKAIQLRDDEMKKKKLMRFQAGLIHQSVDFLERRLGEKPTMRMIREVSAKGVLHIIEPVVENIL